MSMRWCRLYRSTPAELAIEPAIAALGVPYRTQLPGFMYGLRFFPDFALPTLGVVVEIDDPSHEKADKIESDRERDETILREWGWRTVRIKNEAALNDPTGSLRAALAEIGIGTPELEAARRKSMSACLPKPKRAPAKARRESQQAELRRARSRTRVKPAA